MDSIRGLGLIFRKDFTFDKWVIGFLFFNRYLELYFFNPKAKKLKHKLIMWTYLKSEEFDYAYHQKFIVPDYFIGILTSIWVKKEN